VACRRVTIFPQMEQGIESPRSNFMKISESSGIFSFKLMKSHVAGLTKNNHIVYDMVMVNSVYMMNNQAVPLTFTHRDTVFSPLASPIVTFEYLLIKIPVFVMSFMILIKIIPGYRPGLFRKDSMIVFWFAHIV
jgi:hypothetical protein